jgi:Protein of unknown function (DUF1592)/Protein of unknown function (DUF1588)/Protein of unknown function (DUF1595)/Protein of unknown function (DUF1585)
MPVNLSRSIAVPALTSLALLLGCTGSVANPPGPEASGGSAGTTSGVAGSGGGGGMTNPPLEGCSGPETSATKRIVRLSFNQIANSLGALLEPAFGTKVVADFELVDAGHRAFPPLQSPREGNSLTDQSWGTVDRIADAAGKYVFDNFNEVTQCGAAPTDMCAQQYLTGLAQKVYRRPLTPTEQARIDTLYTTTLRVDAGATVNEAVQHTVYALFQTPQFLYRTEFGTDWQVDGPLTSHEVASMLSYFLTDSTPDQPLLDAASQDKLLNAADIAAQVDRMLLMDESKVNLQGAMISYLSYPNLENQIIQDDAFTGDMRRSMFREAELFLKATLWGGKLNDLLTSRKGYVNATLAPIYGITAFPPAGAAVDAEGFALVDLPANRTGLLTQAGFLANRSRPDETSVVGRGLLIKNAFLCTETPPPPDSITDAIEMVTMVNANASQRELANIRGTTSPCNGCHLTFDAYGLALDTFDVLGRYRDKDHEGRPIDPAVMLPVQVGGGTAKDIVDVGQKLAESGAFGKCMSQNLVNYALADVSAGAATIDSCAVARVAQIFSTTDGTFPSLVKSVALSAAFGSRSKGVAQ